MKALSYLPAATGSGQRPLATLMGAFAVLMLLLTLGYSIQSWRQCRAELVDQLGSIMELGEKALDNYLQQIGDDLAVAAAELAQLPAAPAHASVELILKQYTLRNPTVVTASLIRPDGQMLALAGSAPGAALPTVAEQGSFASAIALMRAGQDLVFSRPILGQLNGRWMLPMRHAVRGPDGNLRAIVAAALPVDVLARFWKDAPLARQASIGLLGDDGYLLSRFPVPSHVQAADMYGRPRTGALRRYLVAQGHPQQGVVEGYNVLAEKVHINVFRRLSHHRATLFVAMPRTYFYARWWERVRIMYMMLALTLAGAALSYRGAIGRQRMIDRQQVLAHGLTARLAAIVETSGDAIISIDGGANVTSWNPGACALFGHTELAMLGHGLEPLLPPAQRADNAALVARAMAGETITPFQSERFHRDGHLLDVEISLAPLFDQHGVVVGVSQILRDVSARVQAQRDIARLAYFDALTGLPNRRYFLDQLEQAVQCAARSDQLDALLYIDLDQFKTINDARGHGAGDAVLRHVATRLDAAVRIGDVVARLGGDEFVVLCRGLGATREQARLAVLATAEHLQRDIGVALVMDEQAYTHSASIGISLIGDGDKSASDVLREADTAMYRGKRDGRGKIVVFADEMLQAVEERMALELDLSRAIEAGQLKAAVQPQYDCAGRLMGAELLARWEHPVHGPIGPERFIPLAEESDLICALGETMLRHGCALLLRLAQQGIETPVSVNVSARQFRQANFVERVGAIVADTGIDPRRLIFEVTESLLINDLGLMTGRMHQLCALGIRFSMDDFGTGYSSLAYLRKLPLYELKIDRSFIKDLTTDASALSIVSTILAMAHHLGLKVVAEGVETHEQAQLLNSVHCDYQQGYFHARPMPVEQWQPCVELAA